MVPSLSKVNWDDAWLLPPLFDCITWSSDNGELVPIPIPAPVPLIKVLAPGAPILIPLLAVISPTESTLVTSS